MKGKDYSGLLGGQRLINAISKIRQEVRKWPEIKHMNLRSVSKLEIATRSSKITFVKVKENFNPALFPTSNLVSGMVVGPILSLDKQGDVSR